MGAAECPICLEALWNATPSAFVISDVNNGHEESRVTCAHFFCFDCAVAQYIQQSGKGQNEYFCPICRNPAGEVLPVPDIGLNPRLWYRFIGGHLDQNTLIQAIEALLPLDTEQLRVLMEKHLWAAWSGGSDTVSESNFFSPGGVLEWIRGHQHELQAAQERGPAPSLDEAESWFRHWDGAQRGHLLRGEALRGLCEVAAVSSLDVERVEKLKHGIRAIWGEHTRSMPLERFLADRVAQKFAAVTRQMECSPKPIKDDPFGF